MITLQKGDRAPAFEALDQNEKTISLKDYIGQKVILFFYPRDNTPGCTAEACNLRDNYDTLIQNKMAVIGVSTDTLQSHQKFAEKYQLPFPLLVDEDKKIALAYGVFGPKKYMGNEFNGVIRTTFLIDEQGVIKEIITKVETQNHAGQIMKLWSPE